MAHSVMRLNVTASREFHPSLKLPQKTIARLGFINRRIVVEIKNEDFYIRGFRLLRVESFKGYSDIETSNYFYRTDKRVLKCI